MPQRASVWLVLLLLWPLAATAHQPKPAAEDPRQILESIGWMGLFICPPPPGFSIVDHDERRRLISEQPERFAAPAAEFVRLPRHAQEVAVPDRKPIEPGAEEEPATFPLPRDHWSWSYVRKGQALKGLAPLLGREHADPLLTEFFRDAHRLYAASAHQYSALLDAADRAGRSKEHDPERWAWFQRTDLFRTLRSSAIAAAEEIDSPVLIDPVLDALATGPDDQRAARLISYLDHFPDQWPRIKTRLHVIVLSPGTGPQTRAAIAERLDIEPLKDR